MMILEVMVEQHFDALSVKCFIYPRTTKTETRLSTMNSAGDTLVSTSVKVVPELLSAWHELDVTDKFVKILPDMGEASPHTMTPIYIISVQPFFYTNVSQYSARKINE